MVAQKNQAIIDQDLASVCVNKAKALALQDRLTLYQHNRVLLIEMLNSALWPGLPANLTTGQRPRSNMFISCCLPKFWILFNYSLQQCLRDLRSLSTKTPSLECNLRQKALGTLRWPAIPARTIGCVQKSGTQLFLSAQKYIRFMSLSPQLLDTPIEVSVPPLGLSFFWRFALQAHPFLIIS